MAGIVDKFFVYIVNNIVVINIDLIIIVLNGVRFKAIGDGIKVYDVFVLYDIFVVWFWYIEWLMEFKGFVYNFEVVCKGEVVILWDIEFR